VRDLRAKRNPWESQVITSGNLFEGIEPRSTEEVVTALGGPPGARIERIVSTGQASPEGFWHDQDWTEWVFLISGSARLRMESEETPRELQPGDYLEIPPRARHRVEATDARQPTVWLAVHLQA
jgi:cupin 2 domain-containing protein